MVYCFRNADFYSQSFLSSVMDDDEYAEISKNKSSVEIMDAAEQRFQAMTNEQLAERISKAGVFQPRLGTINDANRAEYIEWLLGHIWKRARGITDEELARQVYDSSRNAEVRTIAEMSEEELEAFSRHNLKIKLFTKY
jgi:hypothetical protein